MLKIRNVLWDESFLFLVCEDDVLQKCIPVVQRMHILEAYHSSPVRGHHVITHMSIRTCSVVITGRLFIKMHMTIIMLLTNTSVKDISWKTLAPHETYS